MIDDRMIQQNLNHQGLPVFMSDIPYINYLIKTLDITQLSLLKYPELNQEVPITIFDKELILR